MSIGGFFQDPFGSIADVAETVQGFLVDRETSRYMSTFTKHLKHKLVLEQLDPNTGQPLGAAGLTYEFENDDLPNDLELGGKLITACKKYPNNVIPDHQVIRTEENEIKLEGEFWCFDEKGRSPLDKAEFLEAMRLEGKPCKLTYMNRITRLAFINEFTYKIHDETNIEWSMTLEVYQHGDQEGLSSPLGDPLTSRHGRIDSIRARLNSNGEALAEMQARMEANDVPRGLRGELSGCFGDMGEAMAAIGQARDAYDQVTNFEEMTVNRIKDIGNKIHRARVATDKSLRVIRRIQMNPVLAAEKALGWAGMYKRRKLLREASITVGRVNEDLRHMTKDIKFLQPRKPRIHIVRRNDTLRSISQQYYGNPERWIDIAKANRIQDPSRIQGTRLIIP